MIIDNIILNNKKIQNIINEIVQIRKKANILVEENNDLEYIAKTILQLETKKCIAIYKAEYEEYGFPDCRGKDGQVYLNLDDRAIGDCSGGTNGLGIGKNMNLFLQNLYYLLEKKDVEESENEVSNTYNGSKRDQMDLFLEFKQKNAIDLEFVLGALAHEAKHTFGCMGGNTFIKEGITEQTTREDADKYGLYMSPTSHTVEANFIRQLELVVGRDEIVKAGLYDEHIKMKEKRFKEIANEYKISLDELNEYFEILRYDKAKIEQYDKFQIDDSTKLGIKLVNFEKKYPHLLKEISEIREKYDKMNSVIRYESISKKFNDLIPDLDFMKLIEKLDVLYDISTRHKKEPDFYRQLYSKDWNKVLNDDELNELVGNIQYRSKNDDIDLFGNGRIVNNFNDIMQPILHYIKLNNLDKDGYGKEITEPTSALYDVIKFQEEELVRLLELLELQKELALKRMKNQGDRDTDSNNFIFSEGKIKAGVSNIPTSSVVEAKRNLQQENRNINNLSI